MIYVNPRNDSSRVQMKAQGEEAREYLVDLLRRFGDLNRLAHLYADAFGLSYGGAWRTLVRVQKGFGASRETVNRLDHLWVTT